MKRVMFLYLFLILAVGVLINTGCKKAGFASDSQLVGVKWILKSITYSDSDDIQIEETFYLLFKDNGTFEAQVDCNECKGTYALDANNTISHIDHRSCTEAFCGDDSHDTKFHDALDSTWMYKIEGNCLFIYFKSKNNSLNFKAE